MKQVIWKIEHIESSGSELKVYWRASVDDSWIAVTYGTTIVPHSEDLSEDVVIPLVLEKLGEEFVSSMENSIRANYDSSAK